MLQDESIEYIQEQYDEKNDILSQFGSEISSYTLYEDIFGDLYQTVPIVFIDEDENKHVVPMSIVEAIEKCEGRNDVLLGGCTYFNNWISKRSAKDIYAFIIDMDNVYSGTLLNALQNDWKTANDEPLPMPTYIVNSGTGLHLYFVLEEPIPNYRATTENLDKLYRALAIQQTTKRVFLHKQVQWFGQDFRMAGGLNKYGWVNTVFETGNKWDIDELGEQVGLKDVHFIRYGEKRTPKNKDQKSRGKKNFLQKTNRQGWKTDRAFYDCALRNCREKTKEGNRYMSMCALTVIAWKCNVPQEELEKDLLSLLPNYNRGATRQIKEKEIYSAMKMYNAKALLTQRDSLENWQGWKYKPIKRNGRNKMEHLQAEYWKDERGRPNINTCKQNRELVLKFMRDNGEIKGRPLGSGIKKDIVLEWRKNNPKGRKADCHRDTGLDPKTIRKWWN